MDVHGISEKIASKEESDSRSAQFYLLIISAEETECICSVFFAFLGLKIFLKKCKNVIKRVLTQSVDTYIIKTRKGDQPKRKEIRQ